MHINRPRRKRVLAAGLILALVFLGGWSASRWLVDPWPARIEFRDALPLCFTLDGRSFALFTPGEITFRDCATGRVRSSWSLPAIRDTKIIVTGAFSPDGRTFAAAIRQNNAPAEVAFIDAASGLIRATGQARYPQVDEFGFTCDGTSLRMGSANTSGFQELVSFSATTGATEFISPPAPTTPSNGVAASPNGQFLLYLDAKGGPISIQATGPDQDRSPPAPIGLTSAGASGAVGFSADGRTLAVGRTDGTIDLWDIPGRRRIKNLRAHGSGYASSSIRFAPDGRTVTSTASSFNPSRFDLLRICRDIYQTVTSGVIRPAVRYDLVVLDLATGETLARSANSYYLYYSPDSRTVATKDDDGRIRLRDLPDD